MVIILGKDFYDFESPSRYSPAPISIQHLLDHGKPSDACGSFLFLRKEIPTRLANMIMELKLLPADLMQQRECNQILNDYITSFRYVGNQSIMSQLRMELTCSMNLEINRKFIKDKYLKKIC